MSKTIQLISPVDGEVYAERPPLPLPDAAGRRRRAPRRAGGLGRPAAGRADRARQAGVDALNGMKDQVVEELARQMGRPVRYGGEFGGVNERAAYMVGIAAEALAPEVVEDSDAFPPRAARESRSAWSSSSRPGTTPT